VQEALTNVAKHAGAHSARVAISEADGQLQIEVQDDGAGFDADAVSDGFGLAGMRERVSLAGGVLTLDSGEHGTLVKASLPVRAGAELPAADSRAAQAAT
jgi:signal transduction histidine kinase